MPGLAVRAILGAAAGLSLTLPVTLFASAGLGALLLTALPFGLVLAWLGHARGGLPISWAGTVFLAMPLFYYIAIWAGMWGGSALASGFQGAWGLAMVGLFGGATGAFLIWVWTRLFDDRPTDRARFARVVGFPAMAGAVVMPLADMLGDWQFVVLHSTWQAVALCVLSPLPAAGPSQQTG